MAKTAELERAARSLITAIEHMGREREVLDECWYAVEEAKAVLEGRDVAAVMSGSEAPAATFNAELEAERRRADRAEEARENANAATLRAEADKRLLEHRIWDEIAWLRTWGYEKRAEVVAGWIGEKSDG